MKGDCAMKSRTLYTCLVVMLSVSNVALNEILDDGGWVGDDYGLGSSSGNENASSVDGCADGDDNDGAGYGHGWYKVWTTIPAQCESEYYLYTWAEGHIFNYDFGYCRSCAYADASVSCPYGSDSYSSSVSVYESSDPKSEYDGPEDEYFYDDDEKWYDPGQGLSTDHEVLAWGHVTEGSDAWTFSHACARAFCNLYQVYP